MSTRLCVSVPIKDSPPGFTPICKAVNPNDRDYFECNKELFKLLKDDVNFFITTIEIKNGKKSISIKNSSRKEFEEILN